MPPTDTEAAAAIAAHHAEMQAELHRRIAELTTAVGRDARHGEAARAVLEYLDDDLLPHAAAEEAVLYPAGDVGETALLVRAMRDEHRNLIAQVDAFRSQQDGIAAATQATAIGALFDSHLSKENDLLIPALVTDPGVTLADLLAGMHELVG